MAKKYFTVSYDDGLEQDRRIIALMEKYGIRGTFNLSSGIFGRRGYVKRFGNFGFKDADEIGRNPKRYTEHFLLSEQEAAKLYSSPNVEVASHGAHHLQQQELTAEEAEQEITEDIRRLSEMFGYPVIGHAFPYGSYNDNVLAALRKNGVRYAREVTILTKPKDFSFDRDQLLLKPTCWQLDSFAPKLLRKFIDTPVGDEDMVFYMWGHGYELDFGTRRGCDAWLEQMFRMVSAAKDVELVTNGELYQAAEK